MYLHTDAVMQAHTRRLIHTYTQTHKHIHSNIQSLNNLYIIYLFLFNSTKSGLLRDEKNILKYSRNSLLISKKFAEKLHDLYILAFNRSPWNAANVCIRIRNRGSSANSYISASAFDIQINHFLRIRMLCRSRHDHRRRALRKTRVQ